MRRLTSLMVVVLAAMFAMTACGKKEEAKKEGTEQKKVEPKAGDQGSGLAATPEEALMANTRGQLPPGHPPVPGMGMGGMGGMGAKGELPPGHPPIEEMMKAKAAAEHKKAMAKAAAKGGPASEAKAEEKAEPEANMEAKAEPKAEEKAEAPAAVAGDALMVATYKVPGMDDAVVKKLTLALAGRDGVVSAKADVEAGLFKVTYSQGCPHSMGAALKAVVADTTLEGVANRTGDAPAKSGCGSCPKKDACAGAAAE